MKYLTFGELLLRLKAPQGERLFQTSKLEATFGGSEANVAVSLANFGQEVYFMSVLPRNEIGTAGINDLRQFGVNTEKIVRSDGRMGIYYLEAGSNQLPSHVVYDRCNSTMAEVSGDAISWEDVLDGIDWIHISGITSAISNNAMIQNYMAVREAKKRRIVVSCDLNFRKSLWKYGKDASDIMGQIVESTDILIANEEDIQMTLNILTNDSISHDAIDEEKYRELGNEVLSKYSNLKMVAITLRESYSADSNGWSACLNDGKDFFVSRQYKINDIVDRVGGGDSFAAGLIFGLNNYADKKKSLEFAVAASCLKHSIKGDYNRVSVLEVEALLDGDSRGRVHR